MTKFACPKCGNLSNITNIVVGSKETTRYRRCSVCLLNFSTCECVKETQRLRQILGEEKASKLWSPPPFKYRTIKQQKRAAKSST